MYFIVPFVPFYFKFLQKQVWLTLERLHSDRRKNLTHNSYILYCSVPLVYSLTSNLIQNVPENISPYEIISMFHAYFFSTICTPLVQISINLTSKHLNRDQRKKCLHFVPLSTTSVPFHFESHSIFPQQYSALGNHSYVPWVLLRTVCTL